MRSFGLYLAAAAFAAVCITKPTSCGASEHETSGQGNILKSCELQLSNIMNPNEENSAVNDELYLQDLAEYNENPLAFLTSRAESCGGGTMNFASLGKVIIGEHADVARIIHSAQVRGAFLGRGRLVMDRLPPYFLLSLSDPGTDTEDGRSGVHQVLHDFVWSDTVMKAHSRVVQEDVQAVLNEYIDRLTTALVQQSDGVDAELDAVVTMKLSEEFTCRYMMKALFDVEIDDETVAKLRELWQTPGYSIAAILEPSPVGPEQYGAIKQAQEQLSFLIQTSPSLSDYEPSAENFNLSKKEWADELVPIIGIAALGGGRNLVNNIFKEIPRGYYINEGRHDQIAAAVLEAGRIKAPVNNVNIILPEPMVFNVGGQNQTLPSGTVVAASLGLASVDPKIFPNPEVFDHTRENLMSQIVNYNGVGFDPLESGSRVCPGRNIALKMGIDVLKSWLNLTTESKEVNHDSAEIYIDPNYWHPKSKNFEIIDWGKWDAACASKIPFVFDPPQRYNTDFGNIFSTSGRLWGRSNLTASDDVVASGPMPEIGFVTDQSLSLFYGILGPHPESTVVPEIFRNRVLWMQDNNAPEYLLSFNRAAWRPNTKEGRAIGLVSMSNDWTWAPTPNVLYVAEELPSFNIQMSPDGKWVKLFRISDDPSNAELEGDWIDMYIVQEGDVFYDSKGNILDYVKPGDIYRLTWHNQGNPYLCDADKLSFSYFARTVASLDEATGTITAVSPGYDDLIKAVTAQPPKDVEAATNDFTTSETMTDEEKFDFLVTYEPDRQMYLSSPPPPFGEVIDTIGSEEGGPGADEVEETSEASFVPKPCVYVYLYIFILCANDLMRVS